MRVIWVEEEEIQLKDISSEKAELCILLDPILFIWYSFCRNVYLICSLQLPVFCEFTLTSISFCCVSLLMINTFVNQLVNTKQTVRKDHVACHSLQSLKYIQFNFFNLIINLGAEIAVTCMLQLAILPTPVRSMICMNKIF